MGGKTGVRGAVHKGIDKVFDSLVHPREVAEAIGGWSTVADVFLAGSAGYLPFWITTSATLARSMMVGAVIGAGLGYFLAYAFGKDVAVKRRKVASAFCLCMVLPCALAVGVLLTVINPALADWSEHLDAAREFLVLSPFWINFTGGLMFLLGAGLLVAGISVLSRKLQKGSPV